MRRPRLIELAFVLYCIEAGLIFLVAPWSSMWNAHALLLPFGELRLLFLTPWCRALVSAFGAFHLVWGAHDVRLWFQDLP